MQADSPWAYCNKVNSKENETKHEASTVSANWGQSMERVWAMVVCAKWSVLEHPAYLQHTLP